MRRSYLDSLEKVVKTGNETQARPSARPAALPEDPKRFYQLGIVAYRRGLSVAQIVQQTSLWNELVKASEKEEQFFTAGLCGLEMPSLPEPVKPAVVMPPVASKPAPVSAKPPAPPVQLQEPVVSPSGDDLQKELNMLKTLVGLLERKLAQPITVENKIEVMTPKLRRSTDLVSRDGEKNITGKTTEYEYEE